MPCPMRAMGSNCTGTSLTSLCSLQVVTYLRVSLSRCPSMPCYGPTKLSTPGSVRLVSKLGTGPVRSRYASVELCSTLSSTSGLACVCLRLDQNFQWQCLDAMRNVLKCFQDATIQCIQCNQCVQRAQRIRCIPRKTPTSIPPPYPKVV